MDLRAEFEGVLKEYGHNILLQRQLSSTPTADNEGRPTYTNTWEKHTVRHRYPDDPSQIAQEEIQGVNHDVDFIYYFKWDAKPSEGDHIWEYYQLDDDNKHLFTIDYSVPMRGFGGRIEFWTVGATRQEG